MGLLNPIALLFGALLGILALLYLWERLRRRVKIPSLLLWQSVPEDRVELRRFRPDWLFALQALLLAALVVGLARPYLVGEPVIVDAPRHILIIDRSASMQTREGQDTRFETVQRQAGELIDNLDSDDEVMLIAAAAHAEVIADFTTDHAAVLEAVRTLEPVDTGTQLSAASGLAKRARAHAPTRTEIVLFTDMPAASLDPDDRSLVRHFAVGETGNNLAISALQIFQGPFEDATKARAHVLVRNFSDRVQHGVLTVSADDQVVSRIGFTIPARDTQDFLTGEFPGPGLVTASLDVEDALNVDNHAYGWLRSQPTLRVLVVSPPSPLVEELTQIGEAVSELEFQHVIPEDYEAEALSDFDAVIFHRVAPEPPSIGALYIYPPSENPLFPIKGEVSNVEVMDWNASHDSLRGLRPLTALPLSAARIAEAPPGSQPLLWSRTEDDEFLLAFAVEDGTERIAYVMFDLDAERLLKNENVNLLVFFLSLLNWVATSNAVVPAVVPTGDAYSLSDVSAELPLHITDPRGRSSTAGSDLGQIEANFAGVYEVSVNGSTRMVIANLFDAAESDVGRMAEDDVIEAQPTALEPAREEKEAHEFGWWMYVVAAGLMVTEWVAWRRQG